MATINENATMSGNSAVRSTMSNKSGNSAVRRNKYKMVWGRRVRIPVISTQYPSLSVKKMESMSKLNLEALILKKAISRRVECEKSIPFHASELLRMKNSVNMWYERGLMCYVSRVEFVYIFQNAYEFSEMFFDAMFADHTEKEKERYWRLEWPHNIFGFHDPDNEWSTYSLMYDLRSQIKRNRNKRKRENRARNRREFNSLLAPLIREKKEFLEGLRYIQETYPNGLPSSCNVKERTGAGCTGYAICVCGECVVHCRHQEIKNCRFTPSFIKLHKCKFCKYIARCRECLCCNTCCSCRFKNSKGGVVQGLGGLFTPKISDIRTGISTAVDEAVLKISEHVASFTKTDKWKKIVMGVMILVGGLWTSRKNWSACVSHVLSFVNSLDLLIPVMRWLSDKILQILKNTFKRDRVKVEVDLEDDKYMQETEKIVEELSRPRLKPYFDENESWSFNAGVDEVDAAEGGVAHGAAWDDTRAYDFAKEKEAFAGYVQGADFSWSELGAYMGVAGGILTCVVACISMKAIPSDDKETTAFIARFSRLGACVSTMETLFDRGQTFVSYVISLFRIKVCGHDPRLVKNLWTMEDWCGKVTKLVNSNFEQNSAYNIQIKNQVDALLTEGNVISADLDRAKIPMAQRTAMSRLMTNLQEFRKIVAQSGAGHSDPRIAPLIVHFVGVTGTGKSTMLWPFMYNMAYRMGIKDLDSINRSIYFRYVDSTVKHWDGYHSGIKIVVVDDIFTNKDSENNPNPQVAETIRTGNNATWMLPQAGLAEKGNTFFEAPLIIWTSNRSNFKFDSITNPEAVLNRVGLKFIVTPKEEYAIDKIINGVNTHTLDKSKIAHHIKLDPSSIRKFVQFQRVDPLSHSDTTIGGLMDFEEMCDLTWELLSKNQDVFADFKSGLSTYLDQLKARTDEFGTLGEDEEDIPVPTRENSAAILSKIINANKSSNFTPDPVVVGPVHPESVMTSSSATDMYDCMAKDGSVHGGIVEGCFDRKTKSDEPPMEQTQPDPCWMESSWYDWARGIRHLNLWATIDRFLDMDYTVNLKRTRSKLIAHASLRQLFLNPCWQVRGELTERQVAGIVKARVLSRSPEELQNALVALKLEDVLSPCTQNHAFTPIEDLLPRLHRAYHKWTTSLLIDYVDDEVRKFREDEAKLQEWRVMLGLAFMVIIASVGGGAVAYGAAKAVDKVKTWCGYREDATLLRAALGYEVRLSGEAEGSYGIRDRAERGKGKVEAVESSYDSRDRANRSGKVEADGEAEECQGGIVQAILDQNAQEVGLIAVKNMYKIEKLENGEWLHLMNVLFVRGRLAICNKHLLVYFQNPKSKFRISNYRSSSYTFDQCELRYYESKDPVDAERDLILLEFPIRVAQHRNIVDKFMTEADFGTFTTLSQVCVTGYSPSAIPVLRHYYTKDVAVVDAPYSLWTNDMRRVGTIRKYIKYGIQSQAGDCGSVVTCYDKAFNRKLIGIHTASFTDAVFHGVAQPVTQNMIERYIGGIKLRDQSSSIALEVECDIPLRTINVEGVIKIARDMESKFDVGGLVNGRAFAHTQTQIHPSPVADCFGPPLTAPALLGPREGPTGLIDPMALAQEKIVPRDYCQLEEQLLEISTDDLTQKIMTNVADSDQRVLSWEEAITGIAGDANYPPINRRSSPGFGWVKRGIGKTEFFGEDEYILDHPEVLKKRDEHMERLRQGRRIGTVFVDTLKDERRAISKVEKGKTRLFAAGEQVFTVLFRQYFLGFAAHMHRNRMKVECCVGINPLGYDWHVLANMLQSKGECVVAGDFTNYDGSLHPDFLWKALEVIEMFYACGSGPNYEEERNIRRLLWCDIVYSIHVNGNIMYSWEHGNPSGCPITTILNSLVHSITARYVYLLCARRYAPSYNSLYYYNIMITHVNYGDDDVWNISEEIVDWFNQKTISEGYAEIGMCYTDEAKSAELVEFRYLRDIKFLKRAFRFDQHLAQWVAPLDLDVILEMPKWVSGKKNIYPLTAQTLEVSAEELALHGREVFNTHWSKYLEAKAILSTNTMVSLLSWQDYLLLHLTRQF